MMGPLGKVGTNDRLLQIRAQKYVSNVNSWGEWQTAQLPSTSQRHRDQGRHLGQKEASGPYLAGLSSALQQTWIPLSSPNCHLLTTAHTIPSTEILLYH